MNTKRFRSVLLAGLVEAGCAIGWAQTLPSGAPPQPGAINVQTGGGVFGFQFVGGEPAISAKAVKGAPFSLEATIESAQTLSDGNRITHRQSVRLYRDAIGRTRREETLAAIGPWAASGTPPTMITIQDPASGINYFLDPQLKIAAKIPAPPPGESPMEIGSVRSFHASGPAERGPSTASVSIASGPGAQGVVAVEQGQPTVVGFGPGVLAGTEADEKSESLGEETIAGVSADGTRSTTVIPANTIGNERPLEISQERWYSPELQIVLRSKQDDPRFGETNYEVTKLDKGDPPSSLFEVPSGYKLQEPKSTIIRKGNR